MPAPAVKKRSASPPKKVASATASAKSAKSVCCALCGIETGNDYSTPPANKRERHQLVPASQLERKGVKQVQTIKVCHICNRAVHNWFSDEILADHLSSVEELKDALTDLGWFKKRPQEPKKDKLYSALTASSDEVESYKRKRYGTGKQAAKPASDDDDVEMQDLIKRREEVERRIKEKQLAKQEGKAQRTKKKAAEPIEIDSSSDRKDDESSDGTSSESEIDERPRKQARKFSLINPENHASDSEDDEASSIEHIGMGANVKYRCKIQACGRIFNTQRGAKSHVSKSHRKRPFACGILGCCKSFTTESGLYKHIGNIHKGWTFLEGKWMLTAAAEASIDGRLPAHAHKPRRPQSTGDVQAKVKDFGTSSSSESESEDAASTSVKPRVTGLARFAVQKGQNVSSVPVADVPKPATNVNQLSRAAVSGAPRRSTSLSRPLLLAPPVVASSAVRQGMAGASTVVTTKASLPNETWTVVCTAPAPALDPRMPRREIPTIGQLRDLANRLKAVLPGHLLYYDRQVTAFAQPMGDFLRDCLFHANRTIDSCHLPFHALAAALSRVIDVLEATMTDVETQDVIFCMLTGRFTCLEWWAWASLDLRHRPEPFYFRLERDSSKIESFINWRANIVGCLNQQRQQEIKAVLAQRPDMAVTLECKGSNFRAHGEVAPQPFPLTYYPAMDVSTLAKNLQSVYFFLCQEIEDTSRCDTLVGLLQPYILQDYATALMNIPVFLQRIREAKSVYMKLFPSSQPGALDKSLRHIFNWRFTILHWRAWVLSVDICDYRYPLLFKSAKIPNEAQQSYIAWWKTAQATLTEDGKKRQHEVYAYIRQSQELLLSKRKSVLETQTGVL